MSEPTTAEILARVRNMWGQGYSDQQIADTLGITKNRVVGVRSRAGIVRISAPRPKAKPRVRHARPRVPGAIPAQPKQRIEVAPSRSRAAAPRPLAAAPGRAPAHSRRCLWPMWADGERPTHRYCGEPAVVRSYCRAHHHESKGTTKELNTSAFFSNNHVSVLSPEWDQVLSAGLAANDTISPSSVLHVSEHEAVS
ncbi:MAG: GcrA family cell cycle regulator [Massilia sp.]